MIPISEQEVQFPVSGRRLGWATHELRAQGIPFQVKAGSGNTYIILIPMSMGAGVQGMPWLQPPPPPPPQNNYLGAIVALGIFLILLGVGYFVLQASPLLLQGMAAPEVAEKSTGNVLEEALKAIQDIPEAVQGGIEKRIEEAKQEVQEAIFNTLAVSCGIPLMFLFLPIAGLLVLRALLRRK